MKTIKTKIRARRGICDVLYGSKGIYGQKDFEYYLIIIEPEAHGEEVFVCSIGTLESAFSHPDYPGKKQYNNDVMAELWQKAGVPEEHIILLLAGLPV